MSIRQDHRTGLWKVDVSVRCIDGRVRRKRQGGFKTQRQAARFERRLRESIRLLTYDTTPIPTLREFAEEWMATKQSLTKNTITTYRAMLRHYIVPELGGMRLDDIGQRAIERATAAWRARLRPRSINLCLSVLRTMLRTAVRWDVIEAAPHIDNVSVDDVRAPFLTLEQGDALLQAADQPWRCLFLVGLGTGLRRGEILGLHWDDVQADKERPCLWVRHNWTRGEMKARKGGKTLYLPIAAEVAAALREHPRHISSPLVFCDADGQPFWGPRVNQELRRACVRANIPVITSHSLRRSFASQLSHADVSTPKIQQLLGHANVHTTMRYIQTPEASIREAVERRRR